MNGCVQSCGRAGRFIKGRGEILRGYTGARMIIRRNCGTSVTGFEFLSAAGDTSECHKSLWMFDKTTVRTL
jgi:hypothetical protein